jgi:hypothetical protein
VALLLGQLEETSKLAANTAGLTKNPFHKILGHIFISHHIEPIA